MPAESPTPDSGGPAEPVSWFDPVRPVGGTVHVRPAGDARARAVEVASHGMWDRNPAPSVTRWHLLAEAAVDALLADPGALAALAGVPHPPPGTFSYDDPRAGRDHMAIYRDFWRDLVETDGRLDLNKVARELADFSFVMDQVPLVYDHVTGGRMTKPMYFARDVISEADERCERTAEEVVAEARAEWEAEAGVPHPGVEELAEVIDPAAFDPRGSVTSPVNAYARGKRQRAALDAAERVRALLGHTPTATLDPGSTVAPDTTQEG